MIFKRHSMKLKKTFCLLVCSLLMPQLTFAADVLIAPPLLDLELQARDVVTKDIVIKNQAPNKIYVYATVNEIAVDDSGDIREFISPVMDVRESAITSWIEISRGRIELEPGEEKIVPLTIRVHPYAEPGEYHAFIGMVTESNRPQAEAKTLRGDSDGVILKVNLADKSSDALRIVSFLVDRFVIMESKRTAAITLKNEGTKATTPTGEIIFYNSRGEEVSSATINQSKETIEPGAERLFEIGIPFENRLGRFKANATVRYGAEGKQNVFDTVQFYMIPYKLLILFAVGIVLFSLLVTYLLRRVFYDELHSEEEGGDIPLYVRNDRDHTEHEHDIHISKK
jgi:hypothetical protein